MRLIFSFLSITILRMFSSVTFLIIVSLKEKFGNASLKPRVRKWHLFALRTIYFWQNHSDIITKSCLSLLDNIFSIFTRIIHYCHLRSCKRKISFIKMLKSAKPKIEPWGTPVEIFCHLLHLSPTFPLWCLFEKEI